MYATKVAPDYIAPWRLRNPMQVSGSGAIISNQRILTNAHIVANAKYIQVQKNKEPGKYIAEVSFVSHEADLALLTVKDKSFFIRTKPLSFGELPKPYQEVAVLGYPMGGESLSITKGVLSRFEYLSYEHSNLSFLAGQIDAAINHGNSGGPVIAHQKIIGIAMQANRGDSDDKAEGIGYFIPSPIIAHVLKDSEDGKYDGFPTLDFSVQTLENPTAKAYFGLKPNQNGVLVTKLFPGGSTSNILKKNDVLLKIDQFDIAGDGSINYTPTLQTYFSHALDLHHIGDKVQITYVRAGKVNTAYLTAQRHPKIYEMIAPPEYDTLPRYYVYAGIIFVPLSSNLIGVLDTTPFDFWRSPAELYETPTKREIVLAMRVLSNDVNFGYDSLDGSPVDFVNGIPIRDFTQFAKLLEQNKAKYVVFENKQGNQMVIDHAQAIKSEAEIFKNYGVPARYSKGLFN